MIKCLAILVFLLSAAQIYGQNNRIVAHYVQEIRERTDPFLEGISLEVPKEYEDASATALAIISLNNFKGNSKKRSRHSYYRLLLKINDRAALKKFSILSFKNNTFRNFSYTDHFILRIIKHSGKEIEVDLESLPKNADKEVAIPNLEIGDILDYGLESIETIYSSNCFDPQLKTLNSDFPIVYGFERYTVERGFFVNFMSQNGAPLPNTNEEKSDRKTLVYDLEYHHLNPISGEIWAPRARTEATNKMQICYYPIRRSNKAPLILGDPYSLKTSSTDEEKMRALKDKYNFDFKVNHESTKYFDKWYKKNFPDDSDLSIEEYMNYAFYHYRYFSLVFNPQFNYYRKDYESNYLKSIHFMLVMRSAAMKKDILFEYVFSTNKDISSLDDILLMSEFVYIIRYKTETGEWKYMENPYSYQTSEYISPKLRGQDAFAMNTHGNITRITIPESKPEDNFYKLNLTIDPDLEKKNAQIDAITIATGIFKYDISQTALVHAEFHEDAELATLPEGKDDVMVERGKVQRGKLETEESKERDTKEKLQFMKKLRAEEYDIEEYISFVLLDSGVKSDKDSLICRENYSIKDVVEKAGSSYILNLSKIVLDQISFTEEDKINRKNDIFIDFSKTCEYYYHINIPEGYKAYGLESFNESVDSKYGSVEITAEEKGNQVVIYLKKVYKKSFIPKQEWPTMMAFLEPAMKLNNARIVLKLED